ncbi:MAG: GNAT family N-acetyltransferase [Chloroflexi bacterium]|nr:GNAT family N-acetyltransferase [Chloroflexota bacterium]
MLTKEKTVGLKEGYCLKSVGVEDLDAVLSAIHAFSQATMGINEMTRSELESFWQTPGLNMAEDLRIVVGPNGKVAGYVECLTLTTPPVHPYIWLSVHPDYFGSIVPEVLLDWAIERAGHVMETLPKDLRVSIHMHNIASFKPWQRLFENAGFALTRHSFIMHRDITDKPPEPQWPAGITLRPFDPVRHAVEVFRANDEAFEDHFGHIKQPFEQGFALFEHWLQEPSSDSSLWFIAMDGDEVAGVSLCRVNEDEETPIGWVGDLSVRRLWRKRGLGMALLIHSFGEFYRRGYKKVGLGADASNLTGALRLYQKAGMYVKRQFDRYEKELKPGKELMTIEVKE